MPFFEDSGVSVPNSAAQLQSDKELLQVERLIQGRYSTTELKSRCPSAFEPSVVMLFLELIEAKRATELWRETASGSYAHLPKTGSSWQTVKLIALAHERAADNLERKLRNKLHAEYGFCKGYEITPKLQRLANETFAGTPTELHKFLMREAPKFIQMRAEGAL